MHTASRGVKQAINPDTLRELLTYTPGRWSQFLERIDRHGFPLAT
jgi:hypothetical protein